MELEDTERRRLAEDAGPRRQVELFAFALEIHGIRAIGTAQRTTVREFSEKPHWGRQCGGHAQSSSSRCATSPLSKAATSAAMRSRGAENRVARSSTIAEKVRSPVHRLRISWATMSALKTRSGASSTHPS